MRKFLVTLLSFLSLSANAITGICNNYDSTFNLPICRGPAALALVAPSMMWSDLYRINFASASHQYVNCDNLTSFTMSNAWTVEFWTYATSFNSSGRHAIISKQAASPPQGWSAGVELWDTPGNNPRPYMVMFDASTNGHRYYGGDNVNTGALNHIVIGYDGGGQGVSHFKFYLNGASSSSNSGSTWGTGTPGDITTSTVVKFGYSLADSDQYWNGYYRVVRVYAVLLTAGQVTTLYNSGTPTSATNLSPVIDMNFENGYTDDGSVGLTCTGVASPTFSLN